MKIEEKIRELEKEVGGKVGFVVWDKKSDFKYSYNQDQKFLAASLGKLFVVGLALEKAQKNELKLDDKVEIAEKEVVAGTGIIHLLATRIFDVHDLCLLTIAESDNTAANKLIDVVGGTDEVNKYIERLGLSDTKITHKFMLAKKGDKDSTTSVRDLVKYLDMIAEGKVALATEFKEFLVEQKNRGRTALFIKDIYGFKTADLPHPDAVVHDAGIIYNKDGDIVLVVLTQEVADRKQTMLAMQNLGRDVYNEVIWSERLKKELPEIKGNIGLPMEGFEPNGEKFGEKCEYDSVEWGKHLGQDFYTKAGIEVVSIADGKVVYSALHPGSKEKRNWGNIVIIAHKYNGKIIFSLCGHLGKRLVKTGQLINCTEPLGEVGKKNTKENGWWEEHLHFAIYKGQFEGSVLLGYDPPGHINDWIDPVEFLKIS